MVVARLLLRSIANADYRGRVAERFAFVPKRTSARACLWFHAVSVGEVIAATPLIKAIQKQYPEHDICVTTMTPTGSDRVRAAFGSSVLHYYLPYDLPWLIKRWLKRIQPTALIIMETELWPNVLHSCEQQGVPVVLANARLSRKSAKAYSKVLWLAKPMLQKISVLAAQTAADAKRFKLLGVADSTVTVTGNIKFDVTLSSQTHETAEGLKQALNLEGRKIAIFASTHPGEDEWIVPMVKRLNSLDKSFLAFIVPRHMERFSVVTDLCKNHGLQTVRVTEQQGIDENTQVLIGDTMGDMLAYYGVADIAFIGGSLIRHGGHNYLEAAAWSLPLLSGKSVYNFHAIAHQLQKTGGLHVVEDHYALERSLQSWLKDSSGFANMGERAKQVFDNNHGAQDKLQQVIESVVG